MAKLRIVSDKAGVSMTATLNDCETAKKLLDALPVKATAQIWGDEVYCAVPVKSPEQAPPATVPSGAVAYWPPGRALCIFFGQTPYSPVNVVGEIDGDETLLSKVGSGDTVTVERA